MTGHEPLALATYHPQIGGVWCRYPCSCGHTPGWSPSVQAAQRVHQYHLIGAELAESAKALEAFTTIRTQAHKGGTVNRGYFAVGIFHTKTEANVGTLWRTAHLYGAAFIFTVGARYRSQASDTPKTPRHTPLFHFDDIDDLIDHLPDSTPLVGVELDDRASPLPGFDHPMRAAYLLGAEDHGIPSAVLNRCHHIIQIPSVQPESMNVAVAGSLVIYDRHTKAGVAA